MKSRTTIQAGHVSHDSLKVHPAKVKHENGRKGHEYKEKQLSLFMFLPFTPTHPRNARPRVSACVREEGGERVKLERPHGSFPAN